MRKQKLCNSTLYTHAELSSRTKGPDQGDTAFISQPRVQTPCKNTNQVACPRCVSNDSPVVQGLAMIAIKTGYPIMSESTGSPKSRGGGDGVSFSAFQPDRRALHHVLLFWCSLNQTSHICCTPFPIRLDLDQDIQAAAAAQRSHQPLNQAVAASISAAIVLLVIARRLAVRLRVLALLPIRALLVWATLLLLAVVSHVWLLLVVPRVLRRIAAVLLLVLRRVLLIVSGLWGRWALVAGVVRRRRLVVGVDLVSHYVWWCLEGRRDGRRSAGDDAEGRDAGFRKSQLWFGMGGSNEVCVAWPSVEEMVVAKSVSAYFSAQPDL